MKDLLSNVSMQRHRPTHSSLFLSSRVAWPPTVVVTSSAAMRLAIDGEWYDLTKWAPHHPGGEHKSEQAVQLLPEATNKWGFWFRENRM